MTQALKFPTGWAIVGRRGRERIVRFAGGRSRRKLEMKAAWMNASGEYVVAVRWVRAIAVEGGEAGPRAQRAARKARRRGEAR